MKKISDKQAIIFIAFLMGMAIGFSIPTAVFAPRIQSQIKRVDHIHKAMDGMIILDPKKWEESSIDVRDNSPTGYSLRQMPPCEYTMVAECKQVK